MVVLTQRDNQTGMCGCQSRGLCPNSDCEHSLLFLSRVLSPVWALSVPVGTVADSQSPVFCSPHSIDANQTAYAENSCLVLFLFT